MDKQQMNMLLNSVESSRVQPKTKMLSFGNTKLKKDGIWTFTIEAGKRNCHDAKECAKFCFGKRGNFSFEKVKEKHIDNGDRARAKGFVKDMDLEIKFYRPKFLRIHAVGEFFSTSYILKWFQLMEQNPDVLFYAYTLAHKKFSYVSKMVGMFPKNFVIIQSDGGHSDAFIDDYSHSTDTMSRRKILNKEEYLKLLSGEKYQDGYDATFSDLKAVKAAVDGVKVYLLDTKYKKSFKNK